MKRTFSEKLVETGDLPKIEALTNIRSAIAKSYRATTACPIVTGIKARAP